MKRNILWLALALALLSALVGAAARSSRKDKEVEAQAAELAVEEGSKPGIWRSMVNKLNARPEEDEAVARARELSADPEVQAELKRTHRDSSAVDPNAASVLGRIKSSIDSTAMKLGLKTDMYATEHEDLTSRLTLADRLMLLPGLSKLRRSDTGKDEGVAATETFKEASDELLKAMHARPKTFGDRVADSLEAVGLKQKSPVKAAAESAAESLPELDLDKDLRAQLGSVSASGEGPWDRLLKSIGVREKSTIEDAEVAYERALHDVKVALGIEDPTLAERINVASSDATRRLKESTAAAYGWLRHAAPGGSELETTQVEPDEKEVASFLHSARGAWDDISARTLASMLRTREVIGDATDTALTKTGIREEKQSAITKARHDLDASMHKVLVALGYAEPTFVERMRGYLPSGRRSTLPSILPGGTTVGTTMGARVSDAWDATLKALHLRDKSNVDKAREAYRQALHRLKVSTHIEDPTAAEQLAALLDSAYNRVIDATDSVRSVLPRISAEKEPPTWSASMRAQYDTAARNFQDSITGINAYTDQALKRMGLRDRSVTEQLRANLTSALESLESSLGFGGAKARTKATAATAATGGMWDSLLKSVGLREKSALEKARDRYFDSLHAIQEALAIEEPSKTEALLESLSQAREQAGEATQFALSYVPSDVHEVRHKAQQQYDDVSARSIAALLHAREEANRLLKKGGLKERNKYETARDAMESSLHDLWVMLGYEEPTLMERLERRWLGAKASARDATAGLAPESTLSGRMGRRLEAAVDAAGEAAMASAETAHETTRGATGIFSRMKENIVGA